MRGNLAEAEPELDRRSSGSRVKTAKTPLERARLAHEADMLDLARHPGVVELLHFTDEEQCASMTTARVPGPTLTVCGKGLPVRAAAGVVAALAQTVADLHDLGVVHGRIEADRVIIGTEGRPVLCGFAQARSRRVAWLDASTTGVPHAPGGAVDHQSSDGDVAHLGELLRHLVGPIEGSPIPEQRRLRRTRARFEEDDRRTLLTLADHATHDDPSARPSAGQLSAAILAAVPEACLPEARIDPEPVQERVAEVVVPTKSTEAETTNTETARADSDSALDHDGGGGGPAQVPRPLALPSRNFSPLSGQTRRRRPSIRRAVVVAVLAAVGVLGLLMTPRQPRPSTRRVAAMQDRTERPSPASRRSPPLEPPVSTETNAPVTSAPAPTRPTPQNCQPGPPPSWSETAVDVDGDGCLDPVRAGDGAVRTSAHRYVVGSVGDPVVVGDWDCNGTATPATVHRASGQLFVFEDWAEPGHDVSVPARAGVPADATLATTGPDGHGCPVLEIHEPGQAARVIDDRPPAGSPTPT